MLTLTKLIFTFGSF